MNDISLIWLSSIQMDGALYGDVLVSNKAKPFSYGMVLKLKELETLSNLGRKIDENGSLSISFGCLNKLTNALQDPFKLEISLFEDDP